MENRAWAIHGYYYTFDKMLGSGKFGYVYQARRYPDNKQFAVKAVPLVAGSFGDLYQNTMPILEEFRKIRELAAISYHIIYVYDFGFDSEKSLAYFVMEQGQQDLKKYLSYRALLTSADRKSIWRQLTDIAVTLNDYRIVHGDIKPQNLIVFPGLHIKLCNLGMIKQAFPKNGPSGTPPYSAPEVIIPNSTTILTTKADVWSLGAILYLITYRIAPHFGEPYYRPPSNQYPSRDPDLNDILQRTLVFNPNKRPTPSWLAKHRYTKTH
ncbi:unnamed protein product [Adineta steineri]|uniref:Protein kinase domain-containing protein n=1 Tax=Adineta steineri TaxID=433720 RepID=A0A818QGZ0_9BILA|nr:unnamed protein product [Adineta steineri]CAF3638996.1 unnamed protein product [Adineta steineri]